MPKRKEKKDVPPSANPEEVCSDDNGAEGAGFCVRISKSEYAEQRSRITHDALVQLLEWIVGDPNMEIKEKAMQLEAFKIAHPLIYVEKYGDEEPACLDESVKDDERKVKNAFGFRKPKTKVAKEGSGPVPPPSPEAGETRDEEIAGSIGSSAIRKTEGACSSSLTGSDDEEDAKSEVRQLQFCNKISMDEYESQKLLGEGGTSQALRGLLDVIVADDKLDEKTKEKMLKDFKVTYPHVYFDKFLASQPDLMTESLEEDVREGRFRRNPVGELLQPLKKLAIKKSRPKKK